MTPKREIHLLAYLKTGPTANHMGGWRHPESELNDLLEPSRYEHIAKVLEAACFDGLFFADGLGLHDIYKGGFEIRLERGGQISFLDPMMVLPLMARATEHIGIGATLSTTFHQPYNIARMLGSLDILSKGRVAWNVVTSTRNEEARNFGMEELPPRELRYDMADEFLEACFALWNCWGEDTLLLDRASGRLVDASKVRYADYVGKWIKTRGPLTIPRCPQGRPVIMQAGSSNRGRDFAARWAELIFCPQHTKADMLAFYADIKARMEKLGRDPDDCAILPQITLVIGETDSIASERAQYLDSLVDPELVLAATSSAVGIDLATYAGDVPPAEARRTQGMQSSMERLTSIMTANNISLVEAARRGERDLVIGTPESIADHLEDLFQSQACDGFVVSPAVFPGMFEQFCRTVVPILQRRGLFRTRYHGRTLRDNLQAWRRKAA